MKPLQTLRSLPFIRPAPVRPLLAGVAASTAYLLCQAGDRLLTGNRYDDLLLWGGLVSRDRSRQRALGLLAHYSLGSALAFVFSIARPALPGGPAWVQAVLFIQAENTLTFPAVRFMQEIHPEVRSGRLPMLFTWEYLWVEALRHIAYGVVLGVLVEDR